MKLHETDQSYLDKKCVFTKVINPFNNHDHKIKYGIPKINCFNMPYFCDLSVPFFLTVKSNFLWLIKPSKTLLKKENKNENEKNAETTVFEIQTVYFSPEKNITEIYPLTNKIQASS